jgi:hypothetical protein
MMIGVVCGQYGDLDVEKSAAEDKEAADEATIKVIAANGRAMANLELDLFSIGNLTPLSRATKLPVYFSDRVSASR